MLVVASLPQVLPFNKRTYSYHVILKSLSFQRAYSTHFQSCDIQNVMTIASCRQCKTFWEEYIALNKILNHSPPFYLCWYYLSTKNSWKKIYRGRQKLKKKNSNRFDGILAQRKNVNLVRQFLKSKLSIDVLKINHPAKFSW